MKIPDFLDSGLWTLDFLPDEGDGELPMITWTPHLSATSGRILRGPYRDWTKHYFLLGFIFIWFGVHPSVKRFRNNWNYLEECCLFLCQYIYIFLYKISVFTSFTPVFDFIYYPSFKNLEYWSSFHTPDRLVTRSIGKRAPPYLTNRRCIWEWCSMQARCAPPCRRAAVRPCSGRFTGCDRGRQWQL